MEEVIPVLKGTFMKHSFLKKIALAVIIHMTILVFSEPIFSEPNLSISEPKFLVCAHYVEGWNNPLFWIRSFSDGKALGVCGSAVKWDRVSIKNVQESKGERRLVPVLKWSGSVRDFPSLKIWMDLCI